MKSKAVVLAVLCLASLGFLYCFVGQYLITHSMETYGQYSIQHIFTGAVFVVPVIAVGCWYVFKDAFTN